MHANRHQHTLRSTVRLSGVSYWSDEDVAIELRPAPVGTGIVFVRRDLPTAERIPASVEYRIDRPRRTALGTAHASVEMVEHILAALSALQIDNCEIWTDRSQMPAFDGSSLIIGQALEKAGKLVQPAARETLLVAHVLRRADATSWIEARPSNRPGLTIEYTLDYGQGPIGRQHLCLELTPSAFMRELAAARTFLLEDEARAMHQAGIGRRVTYQDLLVFGPRGPLQNTLRYADECVRHKLLDLVGDLSLSGCDIQGHIVAYRSGHRLNAELAAALLAEAGRSKALSASA